MNERIKLLAEQAGATVMERSGWTDYGTLNLEVEKFAELIVRECITTMTNLEADVKQKFPWSKSEVISTSGHIQKLKEHFGVEE
jgi:hypothetical protein